MNSFLKVRNSCNNNVTVNVTNCYIEKIGQFLFWVDTKMDTINFNGNTVDVSTCGTIVNSAGALFRIRSGSATIYNNTFSGNVTSIAGLFESSGTGMTIKYNTFKGVTKYAYIRSGYGYSMVFDKNLYLDSSSNVLSTVPSGVSGTGVVADTTIAKNETERANYYNTLA